MFCSNCGFAVSDDSKFCTNCGEKIQYPNSEPACSIEIQEPPVHHYDTCTGTDHSALVDRSNAVIQTGPTHKSTEGTALSQTRIVISFVSVMFSLLILFQSCVVSIGAEDNSGLFGVFLCICWWVGGIMTITKKNDRRSVIVAGSAYAIAGLCGLLFAGNFEDLEIYSRISIILSLVFFLGANPKLIDGFKSTIQI